MILLKLCSSLEYDKKLHTVRSMTKARTDFVWWCFIQQFWLVVNCGSYQTICQKGDFYSKSLLWYATCAIVRGFRHICQIDISAKVTIIMNRGASFDLKIATWIMYRKHQGAVSSTSQFLDLVILGVAMLPRYLPIWERLGNSKLLFSYHGPLTRYVNLRVVHAPEMPGTFSPPHRLQRKPLVTDPGMHHGTCVTHALWSMSGSLTRGGGKLFPEFPAHAQPAIIRIW